jgi:uncharacterized membrane protein
MEIPITMETLIIFVIFVLAVFTIYKLFKLLLRAFLIGVISFSFPWIVKFFEIPLPIESNLQTGIYFALLGLTIFLIYEFSHFIIFIFRILLWPFKFILKKRRRAYK